MRDDRPRSWLRRRWWLLLIALILALPAILAAILLDPSNIEALLKRLARENYGLQVQIDGGASLQVLPKPRLSLQQAQLLDDQGRPLASLQRLQVDLPWRSLWTDPPPLGRIWVADATINGGDALQQWLDRFNTGPPAPSLHWPQLAEGFSARRVRYLPGQPANPSDGDSEPLQDDAWELEYLDLEPLRRGEALRLELAAIAEGYRLGIRIDGRAEESAGALRLAGAAVEAAFGPVGPDDEAVRLDGRVDLSLLPAGGWRGDAELTLADPSWAATQVALALQSPIAMHVLMQGAEDYQTDLLVELRSEELSLDGQWPLDVTGSGREAFLRGDYRGADGVVVEGLELMRESPTP